MEPWRYDVCVVGTGRVGLPLALSLAEAGARVVGVDPDPNVRRAVEEGRLPFVEPGFEEVTAARRLRVLATPEPAAESRSLVVSVATPVLGHLEPDLGHVERVLEQLRPYLRQGHLLCLRSTVPPGGTRWVARWLEARAGLVAGRDVGLAYCPERTAEGNARSELRELPQVVGAEDEESRRAARALFEPIGCELVDASWEAAELVKLFTNAHRYVAFALGNQFAMLAEEHGVDYAVVRALANHRYPRHHLESPGLTGGPCLRKDFAMLGEEHGGVPLLSAAWSVHERYPLHLVRSLSRRAPLRGRCVAVLGYTFKRDSDDARESLVPRLLRCVERELPRELRVSEPHLAGPLPDGRRNLAGEEAVRGADAVLVAVNHGAFEPLLRELPRLAPAAWVADPWDLGGLGRTFYPVSEARWS